MKNHADAILTLIRECPGLNDDQISERLNIHPRQTVNAICRSLQEKALVRRAIGTSGKKCNFPQSDGGVTTSTEDGSNSRNGRLMARIDFASRRQALLDQREAALARFNTRETFTGPSLYFHVASLEAARAGDISRFIDRIYALLPSWGMQRMGRKGPKMVEFDAFKDAVLAIEADLRLLQDKTPSSMRESDWERLEKVFRGTSCMRTNVQLIGNSKVLAHWLPNLVPPIDREYTLAFMPYRGDISGVDNGWRIMKTLLQDFFYPILADEGFRTFAENVLAQRHGGSWHTSPMKLVDNLLIGAVSGVKRTRKRASK